MATPLRRGMSPLFSRTVVLDAEEPSIDDLKLLAKMEEMATDPLDEEDQLTKHNFQDWLELINKRLRKCGMLEDTGIASIELDELDEDGDPAREVWTSKPWSAAREKVTEARDATDDAMHFQQRQWMYDFIWDSISKGVQKLLKRKSGRSNEVVFAEIPMTQSIKF